MIINRIKLLEALEIVKPGLSNKEVIEQSTSFAFMNGCIITYNDEISIVSPPIEGLEIEGSIEADKFYAFLGKIKKEELDLSIVKNEIILTAGRAKAGLPLQKEVKLPLEEITDKGKWEKLPEQFIEYMKRSMACCSRDMSKPVLTAVHITSDGIIEASDNFRITRCEIEEGIPVKSFLIPATSCVEVVKLHPIEIAEAKGWIHFRTKEGTEIACRTFEESFPDVTPFLKAKGVKITLPKASPDVLDRAVIFAEGEHALDKSVDITIEDNSFKISAESTAGWYKDSIKMEYDGDAINFIITPYLLKGILSDTTTCVVTKEKLKFRGKGWQHITLLRSN